MAKNELVIATLPGRTGLYLGVQDGSRFTSIARFTRGKESAEIFIDWAVKSGIRYENPTLEKEE